MYTGPRHDLEHRVDRRTEAGRRERLHIVLPAGYDPRILGIAAFDQTYLGIEFKPLETTPAPKGIADFKAQMAQYKPDNPVNQSAAVGWLSANTLIEGIKAAGVSCPTQKAFISNLRLEKTSRPTGSSTRSTSSTSSTSRSSACTTCRS